MVVLKRLSRRRARRRPRSLAVIRGSAVNQDGRSNGLTAPNGPAQEAVIRRALDRRRRRRRPTSATSRRTAPARRSATRSRCRRCGRARRRPAPADPPLVGSVKTNIGHLEAAAGIAGLIKVVLVAASTARSRRTCTSTQPQPAHRLGGAAGRRSPTERRAWPSDGRAGSRASARSASAAPTPTWSSRRPPRAGRSRRDDAPPAARRCVVRSRRASGRRAARSAPAGCADLAAAPDVPLARRRRYGERRRARDLPDRAAVVALARRARRTARRVARARRPAAARCASSAAAGRAPRRVPVHRPGRAVAGMAPRSSTRRSPRPRACSTRCAEVLRPARRARRWPRCWPRRRRRRARSTRRATPSRRCSRSSYALAALWRSWGIEPDAVLGPQRRRVRRRLRSPACSTPGGRRPAGRRPRRLMQALPDAAARWPPSSRAERRSQRADRASCPALSIAARQRPRSTPSSPAPRDAARRACSTSSGATASATRGSTVSHAFHSPLHGARCWPDSHRGCAAPRARRADRDRHRLDYHAASWPRRRSTTPDYWLDHTPAPGRLRGRPRPRSARIGCSHLLELGSATRCSALARRHPPTHDRHGLPSLHPRRAPSCSCRTSPPTRAAAARRRLGPPRTPAGHWLPAHLPLPAAATTGSRAPSARGSTSRGSRRAGAADRRPPTARSRRPHRRRLRGRARRRAPPARAGALRARSRAVIGLAADRAVDRRPGCSTLGMDSLMAVQLQRTARDGARTRAAGDAGVRPPDDRRGWPTTSSTRSSPAPDARAGGRRRRAARSGRADRDRRDGLPVPRRRRRPRRLLAAAARRAATPSARSPRTAGTPTPSTTRTPTRRADEHAAAAASSTPSTTSTRPSSASRRARRRAWTRSSGCCSRWRGRRSRTPASPRPACAAAATGVFVGINTADYMQLAARRAAAHRRLRRHRQHASASPPAASPTLLGLQRPEPRGRHRVLVVAGRGPPRLPEPARRRVRLGARRRRQPDALARHDASRLSQAARAGARRALQGLRRARRRLRPRRGLRRRRAQARCADALADGDRDLALVRGSAVNQDGRSDGLTVPNGPAQRGGDPRGARPRAASSRPQVGYVEAHGTGTPLGDPIEVAGARRGARRGAATSRPLLVGSVKTNIGHLEAAAGVAGLIKVALALQPRRDPAAPALRDDPNPHIPWTSCPSSMPTALAAVAGRRRAADRRRQLVRLQRHQRARGRSRRRRRRPASRRSADGAPSSCRAAALGARAPRGAGALRTLRRPAARHRTTRAGDSASRRGAARPPRRTGSPWSRARRGEAAERLAALRRGDAARAAASAGASAAAGAARLRLLRPGRAVAGMGRELLATEPVFRDAARALRRRCVRSRRLVAARASWRGRGHRARRHRGRAAGAVRRPGRARGAVALGRRPDAVVGHSVGEVAAACTSPARSTSSERCASSSQRGRADAGGHGPRRDGGGRARRPRPSSALVASARTARSPRFNGPASTVVAGTAEAIEPIARRGGAASAFARRAARQLRVPRRRRWSRSATRRRALDGLEPQSPRCRSPRRSPGPSAVTASRCRALGRQRRPAGAVSPMRLRRRAATATHRAGGRSAPRPGCRDRSSTWPPTAARGRGPVDGRDAEDERATVTRGLGGAVRIGRPSTTAAATRRRALASRSRATRGSAAATGSRARRGRLRSAGARAARPVGGYAVAAPAPGAARDRRAPRRRRPRRLRSATWLPGSGRGLCPRSRRGRGDRARPRAGRRARREARAARPGPARSRCAPRGPRRVPLQARAGEGRRAPARRRARLRQLAGASRTPRPRAARGEPRAAGRGRPRAPTGPRTGLRRAERLPPGPGARTSGAHVAHPARPLQAALVPAWASRRRRGARQRWPRRRCVARRTCPTGAVRRRRTATRRRWSTTVGPGGRRGLAVARWREAGPDARAQRRPRIAAHARRRARVAAEAGARRAATRCRRAGPQLDRRSADGGAEPAPSPPR